MSKAAGTDGDVAQLLSPDADMMKVSGLSGQLVLVRVDFNVPVSDGKVLDGFKLDQALPTIQHLAKQRAKVVLLSPLGRPRPDSMDEREMRLQFSLSILTSKLQQALGCALSHQVTAQL